MATPINIIDFVEKGGNLFLVSPFLKDEEKKHILEFWQQQKLVDHVFIMSSGTTSGGRLKSYALSRDALLANAKAVNQFLNLKEKDIWLSSLPIYHIGGLSIYIRSLIGKTQIKEGLNKWNAKEFVDLIYKENISYCSAVPTQLFDILKKDLRCPNSLKGIFIGGDFLADELVKKALELNWPIVRTYGMTELCSQVASSFCTLDDDGYMELLPIHNLGLINGNYYLSGPAIYSYEYIFNEDNHWKINSPNKSGFLLPDKVSKKLVKDKVYIKPLGRQGEELNIKGKLFYFLDLKNLISSALFETPWYDLVELGVREDMREGKVLYLIIKEQFDWEKKAILDHVNSKLPKILCIKEVKTVPEFERNFLGKLRKIKK